MDQVDQRPFEFGSVPVAPGTLGTLNHPRQARGLCPQLAELWTCGEVDAGTALLMSESLRVHSGSFGRI